MKHLHIPFPLIEKATDNEFENLTDFLVSFHKIERTFYESFAHPGQLDKREYCYRMLPIFDYLYLEDGKDTISICQYEFLLRKDIENPYLSAKPEDAKRYPSIVKDTDSEYIELRELLKGDIKWVIKSRIKRFHEEYSSQRKQKTKVK